MLEFCIVTAAIFGGLFVIGLIAECTPIGAALSRVMDRFIGEWNGDK